MAIILGHTVEPPSPCSYLPDQLSSLEQVVMQDVTSEQYERMLVRGWRRCGPLYFRPACRTCTQCVSLRIPTDTFQPNRSQRRARAACAHFRVEVSTPRVDEQRLALYRSWHAEREQTREWDASPLGMRDYFLQFAFPHPSAREVA